jgi:hypothetical protein
MSDGIVVCCNITQKFPDGKSVTQRSRCWVAKSFVREVLCRPPSDEFRCTVIRTDGSSMDCFDSFGDILYWLDPKNTLKRIVDEDTADE